MSDLPASLLFTARTNMTARSFSRLAILTCIVFAALRTGQSDLLAASPHQGTYSGAYAFRSTNAGLENQVGTVVVTIADTGKVTARFANNSVGALGTATGVIDEDGDLECVAQLLNQVYSLEGTVVKTKAGNLKGTVTQYRGEKEAVGVIEFDLPPAD
jgi:hypothetical protein